MLRHLLGKSHIGALLYCPRVRPCSHFSGVVRDGPESYCRLWSKISKKKNNPNGICIIAIISPAGVKWYFNPTSLPLFFSCTNQWQQMSIYSVSYPVFLWVLVCLPCPLRFTVFSAQLKWRWLVSDGLWTDGKGHRERSSDSSSRATSFS